MAKKNVNHGKIKRDLMIRDTGLDSRFITKVVKSRKAYKREKFNPDKLEE